MEKLKTLVLLGVLSVIVVGLIILGPATAKAEGDDGQPPFVACLEGDTVCSGFNFYECHGGEWLLKEENNETECGYTPPGPACSEGVTQTVGSCDYECKNGEWVLGTCCEGTSGGGGTVATHVLTANLADIVDVESTYDPATVLNEIEFIDFSGESKRVRFTGGSVSGGLIYHQSGGAGGGVPGFGELIIDFEDRSSKIIALPLNTEIVFDNVTAILVKAGAGCPAFFDAGETGVYSVNATYVVYVVASVQWIEE